MARSRHSASGHRRYRRAAQRQSAKAIETLGYTLLLEADDADEELLAFSVLLLARDRLKQTQRRGRYGLRGSYNRPKPEDFFKSIIYHSSERFFRAWMRMDRQSFWELHELIREDPIFISSGGRQQRPSWIQLATFLAYVGGETGIKSAGIIAIAEGTVWLYIPRITRAVRNHRKEFIRWPGPVRRDEISEYMADEGFPGCVGQGDGSYLRAERKPYPNGYAFYCHKGFYAFVIQATCDHRRLITSYDFGWPGSVQDSRVFRLSHLWQHKEDYFRPNEYILVDKGYPLTLYSIRPFNDYDLTDDPTEAARRKRWNRKHSAARVRIEHVFGRLKGRFRYLRCIPGVHTHDVYRVIEALLVIHNFLECVGDDPSHIPGFDDAEDPDVQEVLDEAFGGMHDNRVDFHDTDLHRMGLLRRKELLNLQT